MISKKEKGQMFGTFITDETLRTHYICHHSINAGNIFFEDLFSPDNNLKRCEKCNDGIQKLEG